MSKKIATLTVTELAFLKKCSRVTVYKAYEKFNKIMFAGKEKILWDDKVDKFEPDQSKTINEYK